MRNIKYKIEKLKSDRGVAVLFAVLVAVLMVSIASTMTSIAMRQTILSNTGRDSQYAIFAANTALECALYWDLINYNDPRVKFASSTNKIFPNITFLRQNRPADLETKDIECNNQNIIEGDGFDPPQKWKTNVGQQTTFYIKLTPEGTSGEYCASATVKKGELNGVATTVIEARGYNTCDLDSPRAIERGLELSYTS